MGSDAAIRAPFTPAQVRGLRAWQEAGHVHPFTCGNGHGALDVDRAGWYCTQCDYTQDWAHAFMGDGPPPNPWLAPLETNEHLAKLLDGPVRTALTSATEDRERIDALADYLAEHRNLGLRRTTWNEGITVQIGAHSDEPRPTTAEAVRATLDQIRAARSPAAPAPENAQ